MEMTYDDMLREMEAYYAASAPPPREQTLTMHEKMLNRLCEGKPDEKDDALLAILRKRFRPEEAEVWLLCPAVSPAAAPINDAQLEQAVRPEVRPQLKKIEDNLLERKILLHVKSKNGAGYFARCDAHCIQLLRAAEESAKPGAAAGALVRVEPGRCVGCRLCEKACPVQAVQVHGKIVAIDGALCMGCGACVRRCPKKALQL